MQVPKGLGRFSIFQQWDSPFFFFCAGFFRENTQTFAVLYSVFPVNFAPPICSPLPGRPMRDGCPKGRTSRVPTLQQLGYLEAPILGGVFLGGGCLVDFFFGVGKIYTKNNGRVGGRHYIQSIFFTCEKASYLLFAMQSNKKHRWEKKRHWLYDIRSRFFLFFLHLGFLKMQLVCGEIFGFQVLQSTLGWRILLNQASCFGLFAGHFCDNIPDIFVHFHYSWLICIPSLSFGTDHCRWYNPLKRMNSSFYSLKKSVPSNHNHNTPPNSNQPLGGWVPMTWFFVVIESSPIYKKPFWKGVLGNPSSLLIGDFGFTGLTMVLLEHFPTCGPSWDDPNLHRFSVFPKATKWRPRFWPKPRDGASCWTLRWKPWRGAFGAVGRFTDEKKWGKIGGLAVFLVCFFNFYYIYIYRVFFALFCMYRVFILFVCFRFWVFEVFFCF